jgi:probable HAF family extracellular repeat protein
MAYLGLVLAILATTISVPRAHAAPIRYTVTNLGTLPTRPGDPDFYYAKQLTPGGRVIGGYGSGGFLYSDGRMTNLVSGVGYINDRGETGMRPFNDAGQSIDGIAVTMPDGMPGSRAALREPDGTVVDLGVVGAAKISEANAINNRGQVAGGLYLSDERGSVHPFLYSDGRMTDLGLLPGARSATANALNDAGQVVGGPLNDLSPAFLYSDGKLKSLGMLGGRWSSAKSINNLGRIVGNSDVDLDGIFSHAFLYESGSMLDLNDLIGPDSGWVLESAIGINDAGQIAGNGLLNGQRRVFLLDPLPVPEPTTLALFGLAAAAMLTRRVASKVGN